MTDEKADWFTGRRWIGSKPLRGAGDFAFRLVVLIFFAEFIVGLGYIGYLLSPDRMLRAVLLAFLGGFLLGRVTK